MRISDWSADVCSSDLADAQGQGEHRALEAAVDLFEGRALAGPSASQQRVRDLAREVRGAAAYGGGRGGGGKGFDQHSTVWLPWRAIASQADATCLPAPYHVCITPGVVPWAVEWCSARCLPCPAWDTRVDTT